MYMEKVVTNPVAAGETNFATAGVNTVTVTPD